MRWLLLSALVTGCGGGAGKRCLDILAAQTTHETNVAAARNLSPQIGERLLKIIAEHPQDFTRPSDSADLDKLRKSFPQWSPSTASTTDVMAMSRLLDDSTGALLGPPPPRPSDLAWYAENCWDGKAR